MRTRWESPVLLLGVAAAGVVAGMLLDGDEGRRRRKAIAEGAASAGETLSDYAQRLASSIGATASGATHAVGDGLSSGLSSAVRGVTDTVSSAAHSLTDGVASRFSHAAEATGEAAHATTERAGELAKALLGSIVGAKSAAMGAAMSLLHRRTKLEKIRDSIGDGFSRHAPSSVHWKDVRKAIDNVRPSVKAPAIGGGLALLAVGAGVYLLFLAPNAEDRRRRLGGMLGNLVGDIGQLAHRAGAGLTGREREEQPTPNNLADLVRTAIAGVVGNAGDIHVTLREGRVVLQGSARPEDYDAVVAAAERVAPGFENELQAVAA